MAVVIPKPLTSGDEVLIVATANKVDRKAIFAARDLISTWGLRVRFADNLFAEYHQLAGTDELRLADLQGALDDSTAKAILLARGGYGTSRIIDSLSLVGFKRNPKWVAGFSDITALHGWLVNHGFATLHATMPQLMVQDDETRSAESLRRVLFGHAPTLEMSPEALNRMGTSKGRVVGGNLSMLVHGIGTASDIPTKGSILFLEDLGEKLYHIDRMMVQLRRAGQLAPLAGLVVGTFSDLKDNETPFGKSAEQIIAEHVADYDFPVAFGLRVGHKPPNLTLPLGREAKLDVTASGATLIY